MVDDADQVDVGAEDGGLLREQSAGAESGASQGLPCTQTMPESNRFLTVAALIGAARVSKRLPDT